MPDSEDVFSQEYQHYTGTESHKRAQPMHEVSQTDSAAEPINVDIKKYGTGKPRREIIRTKVAE